MALLEELKTLSSRYNTYIAFKEMNGLQKTYTEFYEDVMYYAYYMKNEKYNRIAILGGTNYGWLCYAYGAIIAGKTVVAADPLLPVDDILSLLEYADVEAVYADERDRKLEAALSTPYYMYDLSEKTKAISDDLEQELFNSSEGDIIFFTSGTSGKAKGVVLPFAAEYENAKRFEKGVGIGMDLDIENAGTMYTPLPFYHIYATTMTLVFLYKGKTICLGNPRRIIEEIAYFKPTVVVGVSSLAEALLKNGKLEKSVKLFAVAGAKCEKSLESEAAKHEVMIQNCYGASETAGAIAYSIPGQDIERMIPVDGVKVFREESDEIVIEASGYLKEYYKNEQATAELNRNGKLYLGDIGIFYEDGTFSPIGRKQDIIAMKNGNKLYCNEIDEELSKIENVKEACVIYVDGKVIAVIVTDDEDMAVVKKQIKAYNKKQPYFRKIDEIWMRKFELPKTNIGKLKRKEVTEQYLKEKCENI